MCACELHIIPGTIHYLSDGLETLHYYARKNFAIIVTAGSYPGYPEPCPEVQVDSNSYCCNCAIWLATRSRLLTMHASYYTLGTMASDAAVSFRFDTPLAFVAAMANASSAPEAGPSSQSSPSPLSSPSVISSSSEESLYTSCSSEEDMELGTSTSLANTPAQHRKFCMICATLEVSYFNIARLS